MNRREFAKRAVQQTGMVVAATPLLVSAPPATAADKPSVMPERSPHAGALALVFQKAAERIRAVDGGNWWHDVEERTWTVQRPFAPGVIDSTHLFTVVYQIGGQRVAAWQVNTRDGTVSEITTDQRKQQP
jgi:hypothetical protein